MKHFRFECFDDEDQTKTTVEFETESDAWSGYSGPMWKFFDFLKGIGFVFHHNSEIGVIKEDGEFVSAADPFPSYVANWGDSGACMGDDECEGCCKC